MRWMWTVSPLLLATSVVGCGGDADNTGETDTDPPPVEIPVFTFASEVNAASIDGAAGAAALDHHRVVNTVFSAIQLAIAEPQTVAHLQTDNGSGHRSSHCWTAPAVAQSFFTIDYSGCDDMNGGIFIDDTSQGPVVIEFLNFTFDDSRTLNGTIALDKREADNNLEWTMYDTLVDAPTPEVRSPVGVNIDGSAFSFAINGGADLDLQFNAWAQWGVVTVSSLTGDSTVLAGGTDAADLQSSNKPSQSMSGPLSWTACRCPYVGTQVYDFSLDISEITIDLDKLDTEDDDEDDPEMSFIMDISVAGSAEVTTVGCGEYEVDFTAEEEPVVVITTAQIRSEIQRLCDIALLEEAKCIGFLNASKDVGDILVTIGNAKMQTAAEDTVTNEFDGGFCRVQ